MGSKVRSLNQEAPLDYVIERLKNMNPLIRLCGQKPGHRLRDLTGDAERAVPVHARVLSMWWLFDQTFHWTVTRSAVCHSFLPTCKTQGQRVRRAASSMCSSTDKQTGEGQYGMLRGHDPDDQLTGGVFVVVRDGESPLHGEGRQFKYVCSANYLTDREVKTFDNQ